MINDLAHENEVPARKSLTGTSLNDITVAAIILHERYMKRIGHDLATPLFGAVGSSSAPEMPKGLNGPAGPSVPITEWIPVQAMKEPAAFAGHSLYKRALDSGSLGKTSFINGLLLDAHRKVTAAEQERDAMWSQYLAAKRRITELSAENDALKAQVAAFTASSPPASDTPLPERRPDGTLKPASKPWSAPVPNGDHRRVGG